ncbi:MAG TPA: amino acid adenylation domain-containing protein [Thermoanaerobaculia bacterium]|nr:amino acid adenylation domain-containing protein [Thermoanaerobaculia bacterium]
MLPISATDGAVSQRDELLGLLLAEAGFPAAPEPALVPRTEAAAGAPLSFAQHRLWLLDQMVPGNPAYNMAVAVRMSGRLEPPCLAWAMSEIVRRHAVLRTVFRSRGGEPLAVPLPAAGVPLPLVELDHLPAPEREVAAERLLVEEARRPFDLAAGPLLRVRLLRLGLAEHVFLAVAHHIVADGWSMGILTAELGSLYGEALVAGSSSLPPASAALPPLGMQYADYAAWQRQQLAGDALAAQLAYWRERLAGELPVLALPRRPGCPEVPTSAGATVPIVVEPALLSRLAALGREEGATLFATLLAGFSLLLARWCGQTEVVVGTPVAGRSRPEIEQLIGCFINTLALRQDLSGDPTFRQLLARTSAGVVDALAHQDLPFEKLVEALRPERRASHSPLFQALLVLESAAVELPRLPGLRLRRLPLESGTAKFEITLRLSPEPGGGLSGVFEYSAELLAPATVAALARSFGELLAGIAADPDRPVSRLPLLGAEELRRRAARWQTAAAAPAPLVPEAIARQAASRPQAPALMDAERRLSYGELAAEVRRLASLLRSRGLGAEDRVALLLDRGAALIVAVLAVLEAGGAYVPLDPELPAERLAAMLSDAAPAALLTVERWVGKLPPVLACHLVLLDADAAEIAAASAGEPASPALPESLAYVIYTSGSTGAPKGVAVPHRALAAYVRAAGEQLGLADCTSFALVSTPAADLGHTVVFPALVSGGCLQVVERQVSADPQALAERFAADPVDCLKIVPSHLAALLQGPRPAALLPRRLLVLGGEPPSGELVRQVRALAPALRVFNHYGPTETTVGVIIHQVTAEPAPGAALPLSSPLAGVSIHLLDRAGEPVPEGAVGELCVGGATLARGYLGQPDKTAAVFVPDPFAGVPGARLYRTGDLARLRPDHALEIVGRADRQLKIRGFRVEPGEIELALGRHPGVSQAAVAFADGGQGARRLVAYLVAREGIAPPTEELRRFLSERLPDYMVPGQFIPLAALPLNANGKLDRAALPAAAAASADDEERAAAPSQVEEVLCTIWAKVLGLGRVAPHENFFDLGGHSVLATQVMARIAEAFQLELPLLSLFELPTVAGLARRIELAQKAAPALQLSVPAPVPRRPDMPLSFAQQRLWFLHQLEPASAAYNMAGMMRASGLLAVAAFARCLNEIVRRHEVLRTTISQVGGRPSLRIHATLPLSVPRVSLAGLDRTTREAEAQRLAAAAAQRPFDLARGPLLRAIVIQLEREESLVVLAMHHIVSDGWSVAVILRELAVLYEATTRGLPSPLPELPLQYADFAVWQREWLQGEVLASQLGYWRRQLAGLAPVIALPTDRPYPPLQTFRGARLAFALDRALVERLKELSREADATLFMTLLGAFATLLHRYSAQEDFAIGSPIAGRNHRELEGLVGFFVNTLAMRVAPAPRQRFEALLGRVRESALGAYAHQDLPFEHLVEGLEVERDLARSPLFQTMFVWQNIETPIARLSGLRLVPLEASTGSAKFELTLALQEMPDRMLGSLEYSADLFERTTIERMAAHFQNLLAAVAAGPETCLGDLALLGAAELEQLARLWGSPAAVSPDTAGDVWTLVAAQAARTPDALAVRHRERSLSHAELVRRAGRLARVLRREGIGPEAVVAVAAERGLELTVALLAVLAAGAAYLPLDPGHPLARQLEILARSGAKALLASAGSARELVAAYAAEPETPARPRLLVLEQVMALPDGVQEDDAPGLPAAPENLAYVIYTSGSTGRPKGAMIERRGLLNHLLAKLDELSLGPQDAVAQTASQGFDISLWQLLAPLLAGGRVEIFGDEIARDPAGLLAECARRGVTVLETVPSLLQAMLAAHARQGAAAVSLPTLRWLIATGEALPPALCREWLRHFPGVPLLNAYGPTECSDDVSHQRVAAAPLDGDRVPIGHPIANLRLYVLDQGLQPLPLGVAGELCVGGAGVGRGYLDDPLQTARVFAPDPWGNAGDRLYRTGDRARQLPDGTLDFLGREDDQIKLRGLRLEPGEIAGALLRHPAVLDAVVVARDEPSHGRELVAYLVARQAGAPAAAELRAWLQASLPAYMVPAAFVPLAQLPLTANGKLDRRALPAPRAEERAAGGLGEVAPRTRLEWQLLEIWREALAMPGLGITDDFFAAGGHSLLAVRLMALVEDRLGIALPLTSLFRGPTVEHLAHLIATGQQVALWSPLVPIQPAGGRPPLFCVHPTGGDVLCYQPLARLLGQEQPLYGLQAQGLAAGQAPLATVPEMAACYLSALRTVRAHGPYALAGWSFGGVVAYEMARQLTGEGEEVALLAILDSLAPIGGSSESAALGQAHWASWFALIAGEFGEVFHQDLGLGAETLRRLSPPEQLRSFVERLQQVSFLPPGAGLSMAESFSRIHEANTLALWRYAASAGPYGGPVTLLRSAESLLLADSWDRESHERADLGWGRLCSGPLAVIDVPGNHNTLLRPPHLEVVAARLADCLAQAGGGGR